MGQPPTAGRRRLRLSRRDAALLVLAAVVGASGAVARPIGMLVAPEVAVPADLWDLDGGGTVGNPRDPWGEQYRLLVVDPRGRLLIPDFVGLDGPTGRERGVGPVEPLVFKYTLTYYSFGPNGIDEMTAGDDVVVPLDSDRDVLVQVLSQADVLAVALALALAWIAGSFHATTRARRLAAALAWAGLVGVALLFVERKWGLSNVLPATPEHLLISPGCALFLSLSFAGTLWIAWAGRARAPLRTDEPGARSLADAELREDAVEDVVGRDGTRQLPERLEGRLEVDRGQLGPGGVGPAEEGRGA